MKHKHYITPYMIFVTLIILVLGLTACGAGGGGGSNSNNNLGSENPLIITGQAVKGPVSGGTVTAYAVASGAKGAVLKTVVTDASGNYNLSIESYSGPVFLEITGGSYTDEATGATINLPTTPGSGLQAVVANVSPGGTLQAQITPLTTMAAALALAKSGGLTATNINAANQQIGTYFGGLDSINTRPINPMVSGSASGATQEAINYGLILGGLSQQAKTLNLSNPLDLIAALAQDISDGTFNGQSGSTPVMLNGSSMNATTGNVDLATALDAFGNDTTHNVSGGTVSATLITTLQNATGITTPAAPTGLSITAGNGQVTISWNPVPVATSYNIYWSTTSGVTKNSGSKISNVTSPYNHTSRSNGTTYYYIVTAVNSHGESAESMENFMIPYVESSSTAPSAPIVTATPGDSSITLSWNTVSGATSYNIYMASESGIKKTNYTNLSGGMRHLNITSPFTRNGLTNGVTYYFVVTAVNGNGESVDSAEVSASPVLSGEVSVSVSPMEASIIEGGTVFLTVNVTGTTNKEVDWSTLEDVPLGRAIIFSDITIRGFGMPSKPGTYHIIATSKADPTKSAMATVHVIPATGTFTLTGDMTTPRQDHTATLLPNGKVLVAGGRGPNGESLSSAELYDPVTGTFTPTGDMVCRHYGHTATLLYNGKVLVVGGCDESWGTYHPELYDPDTGTFTTTGATDPIGSSSYPTATLLPNGNVLIFGKDWVFGAWIYNPDIDSFYQVMGYDSHTDTVYPTDGAFRFGGYDSRDTHTATATLLTDGRVLLLGEGTYWKPDIVRQSVDFDFYYPSTNRFSPARSIGFNQDGLTATLLPNDRVLITGGLTHLGPISGVLTNTAIIYDLKTDIFASAGLETSGEIQPYKNFKSQWVDNFRMTNNRAFHTATVFTNGWSNGWVLLAGGQGAGKSAELYDYSSGWYGSFDRTWEMVYGYGSFARTGDMVYERYGHTATLLPNGKILIIGGVTSSGVTASTELYQPGNLVKITPLSATLNRGESLSLGFDTDVTWSVQEGTAGGTITSDGIYTAPSVPGVYHIIATSKADLNKSGMAIVTVPGVAIDRLMVTLAPKGVQTFTATVYGISDTTVSWSVQEGAAGGTITSDGIYTAPSVPGIYHISATSQRDPTKSATATITVPGVVVDPITATLTTVGMQTFTAKVYGVSDTTVSWSVQEGATGGAITSNGSYTAPFVPGIYHIIATSQGDPTKSATAAVNVTEFGSFTPTGSLITGRSTPAATLLLNGKVLIVGGGSTRSAELYDPTAGTFTYTGSLTTVRYIHTATLLPNGNVLIVGGINGTGGTLASAEIYDPTTGTFKSTGGMTTARYRYTATLLFNGNVLIVGGINDTGGTLTSAEIYDPTTGTFKSTGGVTFERYDHTATLLSNGKILIAGGSSNIGDLTSTELYTQ